MCHVPLPYRLRTLLHDLDVFWVCHNLASLESTVTADDSTLSAGLIIGKSPVEPVPQLVREFAQL